MKHIYLIIAAAICFSIPKISRANFEEEKNFLEMEGIVKQNIYFQKKDEIHLSETTFIILDEKKTIIETCHSNNNGECNFKVPLNKIFEIIVSKKGFVNKTLLVNTRLPKDKTSSYKLKFDIYLFEVIKDLDVSVLKEPIAKIAYNNPLDRFIYNNMYTEMVNKELKTIYSKYYLVNKINNLKPIETEETDSIESQESISTAVTFDNNPPKENTVLPDPEMPIENIQFQIQLIALTKHKLPLNSSFFTNCSEVKELFSDGMYKYTTGNFKNVESAQKRLSEIIEQGFTDAFMVAYLGEKRIAVGIAMNLLQK